MSYVRTKYFNGRAYLYEQVTYRTPAGVTTRHVRYIGVSDEYVNIKGIYEKLGTTKDMNEAGYLMANGDMIDFSGRSEGADESVKGHRYMDHREIERYVRIPKSRQKDEISASRYDSVEYFGKRTKAVRISAVDGVLSIDQFRKLTKSQKSVLLAKSKDYDEFYVDWGGRSRGSKEMDRSQFRQYVRDN